MSWLVGQYIRHMPYILAKPNFESDVYNDCLLIQRCVNDLDRSGQLSEIERDVLVAVYEGYNYAEIARILGLSRVTVPIVFERVTNRVAYILGGTFSNVAFLDSIDSLGESIPDRDVSDMFKRGLIRDQ